MFTYIQEHIYNSLAFCVFLKHTIEKMFAMVYNYTQGQINDFV